MNVPKQNQSLVKNELDHYFISLMIMKKDVEDFPVEDQHQTSEECRCFYVMKATTPGLV